MKEGFPIASILGKRNVPPAFNSRAAFQSSCGMLLIGLINKLERLGVTRFLCKTDGRQDINKALLDYAGEKKQKLFLEIVSRKWHLIYSPNMAYYLYCCKPL